MNVLARSGVTANGLCHQLLIALQRAMPVLGLNHCSLISSRKSYLHSILFRGKAAVKVQISRDFILSHHLVNALEFVSRAFILVL